MPEVSSVQTHSSMFAQKGSGDSCADAKPAASPTSVLWWLPAELVTTPCGCAILCFASGLLGASVMGMLLPGIAEGDDIRSFASFAVGAVICCILQRHVMPTQPKSKAAFTDAKPAFVSSDGDATSQAPSAAQRRAEQVSAAFQPVNVDAPPGLTTSCRTDAKPRSAAVLTTPPGLGPTADQAKALQYDAKTFRREAVAIMKDLGLHRNVSKAVGQVRLWGVPLQRQSAELVDIITFAMEEPRGVLRRTYMAFVAGLAGPFGRSEYVDGVRTFFDGTYPSLCEELPKLPKVVSIEMLPTLRSVLSSDEMVACMPPDDVVEARWS